MADSIAARTRALQSSILNGGTLRLVNARRPWAEPLLLSAALSLLFVFAYVGYPWRSGIRSATDK